MGATGEVEVALLNQGREDEMEVYGYRWSLWKLSLVAVATVCTGGLFPLVLYWLPAVNIRVTARRCPLRQAQLLLLHTKDEFGNWFRVRVKTLEQELAPVDESVPDVNSVKPAQVSDVGNDEIELLQRSHHQQEQAKYFDHQHVKYLWDPATHNFVRLRGLEEGVPCWVFHQHFGTGITAQTQQYRRVFYGYNEIAVKVPSYPRLLLKEVLNPFYIFQVFSVGVWMFDEYYYYATAIIFMSFISVFSSLYTIRKQYCMLRDMVSAHNVVDVTLLRGGTSGWETVASTELVPGDVINIPPGGVMMPCDAVLLNGTAIVNESMLTGESVPVTKTALPMNADSIPCGVPYSPEEHRRQTLFCGSHVLQTRFYGGEAVCAVVVRTGFSTAKGQLVRSILFPKPIDIQLYRDAVCFLMCLAALASAGMVYTIVLSIMAGEKTEKIVVETLDIVTITVPPALPAALTAGIVYAQRRLKRQGIFSTSPNRINICGQINLVAFDKTGTLTEDGLDLWGVVPIQDKKFLAPVQQISGTGDMVVAMATCHSLTRLGGELSGDPLDLKMFEATGWILEEPTVDDRTKYDSIMPTVVKPPCAGAISTEDTDIDLHGFEVGIVQQFPFSSTLQRMSVVTRTLGERHMHVYCKGAPEMLATLCAQDTIPEDFLLILRGYTRKGFRVLGLAHRRLESKVTWHRLRSISRETIESNLEFVGLLVMQNKLKVDTISTLEELQQAGIRPVMITGDNILTAISVARNCGMVAPCSQVIVVDANFPHNGRPASIRWNLSDDTSPLADGDISGECSKTYDLQPYHFAVCGRSYSVLTEHFPDMLPKIAVGGTVFARMSPDQKTHLIEALQNVDYIVGMCGDGANDCGALKRAHGGISLSALEASVASPFTSCYPSITCVATLIREGRAALMTSFCVFKFMALYSIMQFSTVLLLYSIHSNLGDFQFLFIDMFLILSLAFTMSLAEAWKELTLKRPPFSLTSPRLIVSLLLQVVIMVGIQVAAFLWVRAQPWHDAWHPNLDVCGNQSVESNNASNNTRLYSDENNIRTFENTTLFFVSSFQYIFGALAFSKGPPFRQPVRRNCIFLFVLLMLPTIILILLFLQSEFLSHFFEVGRSDEEKDKFWCAIEKLMENVKDEVVVLVCLPLTWRLCILLMVVINFILSYCAENCLCDQSSAASSFIFPISASHNHPQIPAQESIERRGCWSRMVASFGLPQHTCAHYKRLAQELQVDPDWPPINTTTLAQASADSMQITLP
uniref:polyamine-transporting ATPase 13A3 isoform X2 n=1 Tax=Myxine glutinosa TaxID=7769 RepID=UPI00358F840E